MILIIMSDLFFSNSVGHKMAKELGCDYLGSIKGQDELGWFKCRDKIELIRLK